MSLGATQVDPEWRTVEHHRVPPIIVDEDARFVTRVDMTHTRSRSGSRSRSRSRSQSPVSPSRSPHSARVRGDEVSLKSILTDRSARVPVLSAPELYADDDEDEQKSAETRSLLHRPTGKGGSQIRDVVRATELTSKRMDDDKLAKMSGKLRTFYKNQNLVITGLQEMERLVQMSEEHGAARETKEAEQEADRLKSVRFAVTISFMTNIALFVLKVAAAAMSGSLSVIASAMDSLLDLLSGSILYFIGQAIDKRDPYKYPVSKSRLEPLGIIVFAAIMGMTSVHILEGAMEDIISGVSGEPREISMSAFTIGVLACTILAKFCLYVYCSTSGGDSAVVDALVQDHRNDMATNSIGMLGAILAGEFRSLWYLDAIAALVLSLYIMLTWLNAGKEQIGSLVGRSASPELIGQLVYLAAHHDKRILRVDKVLAYHFGSRYMCEVDIVLPEDMTLKNTHDIGETLEIKIEQLSMVERAFVHIDYEWDHKPEHKVV